MDNSSHILCRENPEAFMQLMMNDNSKERLSGLRTIDDLIVCECLRYGYYNDPAMIKDLIKLFDEIYSGQSEEIKRRIYSHVAMIVPQLGGDLAGAFTPFMMLEDDLGIVSTATVDYASIGTLSDNNPMTRPIDIITMVEKNMPRNPAAVIGGLLVLGDPRVCKLLEPLRSSIPADYVPEITKSFSGFSYKCVIEFYLDWIEELIDERDFESESVIGNVIAGLYRLAKFNKAGCIMDGLRPFPVPRHEIRWDTMKQLSLEDYTQSISSRLYDLERREGEPKVMPHVIRAFGLVPLSPSEDIGMMH